MFPSVQVLSSYNEISATHSLYLGGERPSSHRSRRHSARVKTNSENYQKSEIQVKPGPILGKGLLTHHGEACARTASHPEGFDRTHSIAVLNHADSLPSRCGIRQTGRSGRRYRPPMRKLLPMAIDIWRTTEDEDIDLVSHTICTSRIHCSQTLQPYLIPGSPSGSCGRHEDMRTRGAVLLDTSEAPQQTARHDLLQT